MEPQELRSEIWENWFSRVLTGVLLFYLYLYLFLGCDSLLLPQEYRISQTPNGDLD